MALPHFVVKIFIAGIQAADEAPPLRRQECARLIDRARLAREGGPWLAFQDDQCLGGWRLGEKTWENDGKI